MTIHDIGPWALLAVGAFMLLAAIWGFVKGKEARSLLLMLVFGFGVAGVGIFGPAFLGQYSEFVEVLMQMQSNPSDSTYAAALSKVAGGEFPESYDSVIVGYVLGNPIDGMDSLLTVSARGATPQRKPLLETAEQDWKARQDGASLIADRLVRQPDLSPELERLDPITRTLVSRDIHKRQKKGDVTLMPAATGSVQSHLKFPAADKRPGLHSP